VAVYLSSFAAAFADPAQVDPADLANLFKALQAPNATEAPRQLQAEGGFLRFIGAPPGTRFLTGAGAGKSGSAEQTARAFLSEHAGVFGKVSLRTDFATERISTDNGQSYVHFQQTYNGLTVFGAHMVVQADNIGVAAALSDILRDPTPLDNGDVSLSPTVSTETARNTALGWVARRYSVSKTDLSANDPMRVVFDPLVVGQSGPVAVAWLMTISGMNTQPLVKEVVFVDGHSGEVLFNYALIEVALERRIFDSAGRNTIPGTLVRVEGDPPSNIQDVNQAYDFSGDFYSFYYRVHNRDSFDAQGKPLMATVRLPMENAMWMGGSPGQPDPFNIYDHVYFGTGWAVCDVTVHEFTHGVTQYTSNLIYSYQSGAMNESFSDMWGEFVDLTNGRGNDRPAVRWLIGEDLAGGPIRSMKDPTEFGDPDRLNSPLYYRGYGDNGGVHTNSGVTNKLCYLLTDGDTFNGQTVKGMGVERTAKLFYDVQTNWLTEASDFLDLYMGLGQATVNLGLTFEERLNVKAGAEAVEIAITSEEEQIRGFRAIPSFDAYNRPVVALSWGNPTSSSFRQVILVRDTTAYPRNPSEGMELYRGRNEKFLDTAVVAGTEYFYTLFSDVSAGFPDYRFSRAVAGSVPADFLSEAFSFDPLTPGTPRAPFDLAFTQILFSPTGPAVAPIGESELAGDYANYAATIKKNVYALPVVREDEQGAAMNLPLTEDGGVSFASTGAPFPFFGKLYYTLYLAANGYVAFQTVPDSSDNNFPSLAAHYAIPRISFLFADLALFTGGNIWARDMNDRLVATFENVPEWRQFVYPPSTAPNTVQVELFYSGHIRITYLEINARNAVVGLSDGQGAPIDPATLFPGLRSVVTTSNLSDLPAKTSALTFDPIALQKADAGQPVTFMAHANFPANQGTPVLAAQWDGPGPVPFSDNHDGTGTFQWETGLQDFGSYVVRVIATLGPQTAYQDVTVAIGVTEPLPTATNLLLRSNNPVEDPRRDRIVSDDSQLIAEYTYSHPLALTMPKLYAEAFSEILWFRDNVLVSAYNNQRAVPPIVTHPNEQWFFSVTPVTASGLRGMPRKSPVVTIVALPEILNVALPQDLPAVVTPDDLPLANLPTAAGPSSGGTTVAILGRRLGIPLSVTFGGIEAEAIKALSDFRIEAVTPAHVASPVVGGSPIAEDVVVTTAAGTGILQKAFAFVDTGTSIAKADVNRDGVVNAVDVQLVINAVLKLSKSFVDADVNRDGKVNAADVQAVINEAISK
jgi:Zn-dependent metalloprotease